MLLLLSPLTQTLISVTFVGCSRVNYSALSHFMRELENLIKEQHWKMLIHVNNRLELRTVALK